MNKRMRIWWRRLLGQPEQEALPLTPAEEEAPPPPVQQEGPPTTIETLDPQTPAEREAGESEEGRYTNP